MCSLYHLEKANAIHKFFVDEVWKGNDNCERHYVSRDTLVELLDRITTILDIKTPVAREMKAEELYQLILKVVSLVQRI